MRRRLTALIAVMAVVLTGLCVRLYGLMGGSLQQAAQQQSTRRETVAVSRGTVYDRYLQPLVNRTYRKQVTVAPFADSVTLMERTLKGAERHRVMALLRRGECATVVSDTWLSPTVGVTQLRVPCRYEQDALACHVVGYTDGENNGVSGMEKAFDEVLEAYRGEADVVYAVDALGRIIDSADPQLTNTLANAAGGIVLTLDAQIQRIAQQAVCEYLDRGAVVITDVASGDVLASVSVPVYDQNAVEQVLDDARAPLLDRTRTNYDLGSVFKIITAAAALEQGVPITQTYRCDGFVEVDQHRFHCHNPLGDGEQTMTQAMANSCNCYFIQLALDIGATAVYDMAVKAGFSDALTLAKGYATPTAVLPSRRDLSADAALANAAIGQGDLLATPYHVATLVGAVASDGVRHTPSLFYGTVGVDGTLTKAPSADEEGRLFSSQTARQLREMLCAVVKEGTGTAATVTEKTAAGKTGTAQTGWVQNGQEVVQSWFAGYYPAEDPQYVITVLSENGGVNGKTAAPLFAKIADELFYAGLAE